MDISLKDSTCNRYCTSFIRCCSYHLFCCSFLCRYYSLESWRTSMTAWCIRHIWAIQRWLLNAVSSMHSLSGAIVHILAATIQGWRLFCSELPIVRLLFEGSNCLRAASIRRLSGNKYYFCTRKYFTIHHHCTHASVITTMHVQWSICR